MKCTKTGVESSGKSVQIGKNMDFFAKQSFPTYPHQKCKKTWKKRWGGKVIHVNHKKIIDFGGQLREKTKHMFWEVLIKMQKCRKKKKKRLTFLMLESWGN